MTQGPASDWPSWPGAQHQHTGPKGQLASPGAWLGLGPWPAPECSRTAGWQRPGSAVFHHLPPAYVPSTNHVAWSAWPRRRQASICLRAAAKLGEQNQQSVSPGLRRSGSVFSCDSICPGLGQSPGWTFLPPAPKQPTTGLQGQMLLSLPGGSGKGGDWGVPHHRGPSPATQSMQPLCRDY